MTADSFKVCSICRTPIPYGAKYYLCSVSTCRSNRTGLFFCSLPCFEAHVPELRHRDAWAEEERAPTREQAAREAERAANPTPAAAPRAAAPHSPQTAAARPAGSPPGAPSVGVGAARPSDDGARRRIVGQPEPPRVEADDDEEKDVLVVVSKLKKFIRDRSGMNTSDTSIPVLSDHLRWLSVEALRKAAEDGRKTVMDRDYEAVIRTLRRPG